MAIISVHHFGKTCEGPLAGNFRRTSGSRRIPPHGARPPRKLAARSQASDLGTDGNLTESPAPSPEAKPDMAAPVLEPSPAKP